MRSIVIALLVLVSLPAFAIDVIANMPTKPNADSCQLFMNGTAAGTPKPCGSAQSFPNLIPGDGTYSFTYRTVNAIGSSTALSPARVVTIGTLPTDPTDAPTITIACNPAPCPASIVITIEP